MSRKNTEKEVNKSSFIVFFPNGIDFVIHILQIIIIYTVFLLFDNSFKLF